MSLVKVNSAQIGQSATATQNFTLAVPASPDGTVKLARGNSGATTQDVLTVDASGNVNAPVGLQQGGVATGRMVLGTSQATTSGTAIDFTGIPSWAKKITIMFNGVSTAGANSTVQIQVGAGSIQTTSYVTSASFISGANACGIVGSISSGFNTGSGNIANAMTGHYVITVFGSNQYIMSGNAVTGSGGQGVFCSGSVALSGVLDRLRITTVNGTDTFDAGSVNILYEG